MPLVIYGVMLTCSGIRRVVAIHSESSPTPRRPACQCLPE